MMPVAAYLAGAYLAGAVVAYRWTRRMMVQSPPGPPGLNGMVLMAAMVAGWLTVAVLAAMWAVDTFDRRIITDG